MQLSIKNFGTIKDANIIVDGITVITGNNNTGKSTIGKVFYTFFNSFYEIEEKIDLIKKRLPEHSERRFLIAEIFHFLLYIKDNFSFLRRGLLFPSILI